jgi:aspartyl-tRNA(Asn)/glutamyl-tRNA(Gln) amidotransferase subunit A
MTDESLAHLTLTEVAAAIAAGKTSSLEVTRACLARIARHDDKLGSIAGIDPEAAEQAARAADADLGAGKSRGPLHGVPLAHKDMFYRAGRVSACGSRILADFVPDHTATVLTRLDAAGALDIARLSMVEFALGTTGHNEVAGTPRNPWNRAHITGGSSSGPGAAVAARFVYGALGSDTGGSIRLPAACCGLIGLKPTYGRVSRHGAMPLSFTLDHIGPLTRSVADAALMLHVIAGPDSNDVTSGPRPVPNYTKALGRGIKGLRVATPENYFYEGVTADVAALMRRSLDVLAGLGAEIVPVRLPDSIAEANALNLLIIAVEGAAFHGRWLRQRRQDYGRLTHDRLLPGLLYPATAYVEALTARQTILADLAEAVFARADVLHTPVWSIPAPTIAESDQTAHPNAMEMIAASGRCVRPFNLVGLPAISVPAGFTANGLPSAFQLIARPFAEDTLLAAAAAYEAETACTAAAPPL